MKKAPAILLVILLLFISCRPEGLLREPELTAEVHLWGEEPFERAELTCTSAEGEKVVKTFEAGEGSVDMTVIRVPLTEGEWVFHSRCFVGKEETGSFRSNRLPLKKGTEPQLLFNMVKQEI